MIADIHAHITLRPFAFYKAGHNSPLATIRYSSKFTSPFGTAKYTQSDLTNLWLGNVKLVFAALYPFEQGWLNLVRNLHSVSDEIIASYLRLPHKYFEQIESQQYKYFDQLLQELEFLQQQVDLPEYPFAKIPDSASDFNLLLNQNDKIIIIPTIEGAHSLINGNAQDIQNHNFSYEQLRQNILLLKQKPIFFITLAHHFNNGLIQQAKSIYVPDPKVLQLISKPPQPITPIGKKVIDCLLSISPDCQNTRPIFIDVKHMGVNARKLFYQKWGQEQNWRFPIIASHIGFSGLNTLDQLLQVYEQGPKIDSFRAYEINLTTEDVMAVYKSRGIIGIILDQKKLGNISLWKWVFGGRLKWIKLFTNNLLEMVARAVDNHNADRQIWDIFAIGSDYDGVIDPLNRYPRAKKLKLFANDLKRALEKDPRFERYKFDYTTEQIVDKIIHQNIVRFTKQFLNFSFEQEIA